MVMIKEFHKHVYIYVSDVFWHTSVTKLPKAGHSQHALISFQQTITNSLLQANVLINFWIPDYAFFWNWSNVVLFPCPLPANHKTWLQDICSVLSPVKCSVTCIAIHSLYKTFSNMYRITLSVPAPNSQGVSISKESNNMADKNLLKKLKQTKKLWTEGNQPKKKTTKASKLNTNSNWTTDFQNHPERKPRRF